MAARNSLKLLDKVAIVTGSASGIGKAVANLFAQQGASLVLIDKNKDNIEATLNSLPKINEPGDSNQRHVAYSVDVSNADDVSNAMDRINQDLSTSAHVLVNCAGVTADRRFLKMSEVNFDKVIDINLKGTFLTSQFFSRHFIERQLKNGAIVNISSIVGKTGNIGQVNYAASKAGVVGLTKSCAQELASHGIRCNAVLPGFITTPMTDAVPKHFQDMVKDLTPMGTFGEPSDIAETCLFLVSDSSRFITGATIEVTGGLSM